MSASETFRQNTLLRFVLRLAAVVAVVSSTALGVGHAASLGGIDSDQLASFNVAGTVPPGPTTTTTTTTTTLPPVPLAECGVGPTNVACVVPAGTTYVNNLDWDADVLVLGTVRNNLRVSGGTITIGSGGVVGRNTTQSGPGGVIIAAGGINQGHVRESGPGSVTISGTVGASVEEGDAGDLVVTAGASIASSVTATPTGTCTIDPTATVSGPRNGDCA